MDLHNLQPTSFIGRSDEISEIIELLTKPYCRLLSLVGFGGIGKTRLAIEAVSRLESDFPDGIYFVPLQSIISAENIVSAIASSIGFRFTKNTDLDVQLSTHLHDKQLLLILDNFEHLLDAADRVASLLTTSLKLKILITSREPLKLREEWVFHLDGLSFASSKFIDVAHPDDAIKLFAEHASRVRHDFSLPDDFDYVIQICQLVHGTPLAIELAAAWCQRLPCHKIASELQSDMNILQTDLRNMPDRHRSMRYVIDQSWVQLTIEEQQVLMGVSVFRGGFQSESAEKIVGASRDNLLRLVDKSLLRINKAGRYDIHELMRQYASERLDENTEFKTRVRDQHCTYFSHLMDVPVGDFLGKTNTITLKMIDSEIDNARSAWYWAIEQRRVSDLFRAAGGIYWYTWIRNWHEEGSMALGQAVVTLRTMEQTAENQITLCHILTHKACMDIWLGPEARALAREQAQESLNIVRSLDAKPQLATALGVLGEAAAVQGDIPFAKPLLVEAIPLLNETGQHELEGYYLSLLGRIGEDELDYEAYYHWHHQALALGRQTGDQFTITTALGALGDYARLEGDYLRARQLLNECLSIAQNAELNTVCIFPYQKLGEIAVIQGKIDAAREYFETSLQLSKQENLHMQIAWSMIHLADFLTLQGEYLSANQYYEDALAMIPDRGVRWGYARAVSGLGNIAFYEGNYNLARQHHHNSLEVQRQNNTHIHTIRNLIALGRIELAQRDITTSSGYFLKGLQEATRLGFSPDILDIFVGLAELFMQLGNLTDAIKLSMIVTNHTASSADAHARAAQVMNQLETQLFADDLTTQLLFRSQEDLTDLASHYMIRLTPLATGTFINPLSKREVEVVRLVATGMTNKEIADQLVLSVGTIKRHVYNISAKLDARNRTHAVERARELSLL